MKVLIEWITKPILYWSVLDILIMIIEFIVACSATHYLIKGIKLIIRKTRLFKNNLTKPK